jgi:hypothetical protein
VLRAVALIGQLRATGESAGLLGFIWHGKASLT